MTLATMADRALPLAERVASALSAAARGIRSDEIASISDLVADVAAAERLAEADVAVCDAADAISSTDRPDRIRVKREWNAAKEAHIAALAAYRDRKEVERGV